MVFQPLKMAKVAEATPCGWKMTFTKKYRYLTWKNRQKVWFQPLRAVIFTDLNILMQWATNGKNWESTTNWMFASNLELKSQEKWGKNSTHAISQFFCLLFSLLFSFNYFFQITSRDRHQLTHVPNRDTKWRCANCQGMFTTETSLDYHINHKVCVKNRKMTI